MNVQEIIKAVDSMEMSSAELWSVFMALSRQTNCIGGKIWTEKDVTDIMGILARELGVNDEALMAKVPKFVSEDSSLAEALNSESDEEYECLKESIRGAVNELR